jgi:hypothetical protein
LLKVAVGGAPRDSLGQCPGEVTLGRSSSGRAVSGSTPNADSERLLIEAGGGLGWVQNHQFCAVR